MTTKNPYWIVGNQEGRAYVERDADIKLRRELTDNQRYLFLYGPRHSGTSSLIVHCMDSLSPGQYCCTRVDVSRLPLNDYATFIGRLLETVAQDTALDKQVIRTDAPEETILSWLGTFPQRLVLFLDEVHALARAPFRDQLFGKLRFLYNVRVENTQYSRLQVVLAGAAHPERLIPAALATPFAGGAIGVPPLSVKQVEKLSWDLETAQVPIDPQISHFLAQQTGGNVHLCQLVLHTLWNEAAQSRSAITVADAERAIDRLVHTAEKVPHFMAIYQAMTDDPSRLTAFLMFVLGTSPDSGILRDLSLLGLCDAENPFVCPIYERVFGPAGPLDLQQAMARMNPGQSESAPSQRTPQVHIEPPSEARREHSLLARLAEASRITPQREVNPFALPNTEAEALPEPPTLAAALPEPPRPSPVSLSSSVESLPALIDLQADSSADFLGIPGAGALAVPTLSLEPSGPTLTSRAPAAAAASSNAGQSSDAVVEIDQTQEEESTWVEDPVKEMTNQLAAARAEKARVEAVSPTNQKADPKLDALRETLENKLMLSAELDSFCTSFFPHVAEKFVLGMSRQEKTDLLLSLVTPKDINRRLREWSSRLDVRQDIVNVVASGKPSPAAPIDVEKPKGQPAAPSPAHVAAAAPLPAASSPVAAPSTAASPPATLSSAAGSAVEEPANYKPPINALQVGVGLVLANRYFLTNELARGPVAVVWSAYDRIKDEQVALKLLHGATAEKSAVLEVFWRSAHQMAALSHPAIVGILNKPREENEIHYVVMECLSGGNLRQWVQGGKLSRVHIMRVLQRLGAGLQYAHERRVLHRNIKPTNILFDSTGHARLTDFGMVWPAEAISDAETRSDRLTYTAPEEQLAGSTGDPRADVYSLGMCALYAIHGQELPSRAVQDRGAFIDQLDATPQLKAVLRRATAGSPSERYASAAEFCRALDFDAPMLPGVSPRNSIPPEGQRYSERSGAIQALPSSTSLSGRGTAPAPPIPAAPPPPIPEAPASRAAQPAAGAADSQAPIPQLAMPPLLFSDPQAQRADPAARDVASPPRVQPPQPIFVSNAGGTPGGMAAPVAVAPHPGAMQRPASGRWQPFAMMGLALLAVGGAGLGYWWGGQRSNLPVANHPGSDNTTGTPQQVAVNRPLRVESLLPPADPTPPPTTTTKQEPATAEAKPVPGQKPTPTTAQAASALATTTVPQKPSAAAKSLAGIQVAAAPGQPAAKTTPLPIAKKTAAPITPAQTAAVAAAAKPAAAAAKPVAPLEPKPTAIAQAKPVGPAAAVRPAAPATKPTLVAANTPRPVTAQPKPVQRPLPATPAAQVYRPQAVQRPVAMTPPPRPTAPAESQGPSTEAALQAAQQAFVRGQHHQAISLAMQVTSKGGPDAVKAWRFVGGAACSSGQAQLATNAYNHLRDPEHRRMLVELCRRNGLQHNGSQFSSDE